MTRRRRLARPCGGAIALVGVLVAAVLPATPADGQSTPSGYDFVDLHALADGVTVDFNLVGFLPIEDLVGLSSITSEANFGAGRSDALAALPDPGDLVLTLPGTLSALAGVSGIPDYPAAARAEDPATPLDVVQIAPDATLGVGTLRAEASDTSAAASAHVGHQVDTIGLLPSFSVGTIRTTARTTQLNEVTLESVATTTVSDLKLLGGLVSISQITSEVSASIINDTPQASISKLQVSGATLAGTPVGITEEGIVGLGSAVPLAPVIDTLLGPLRDEGIDIRTTPASEAVGDRTAVARGGALEIEVPLDVQGYAGRLTVSFGRALAELEVSALADGADAVADDGTTVLGDSFVPLPGLGSSTSDFGLAGPTARSATGGARPTGTEVVSVPVGRVVEDWNLTTLYRVLLLSGIALFLAGQVIVRSTTRPSRRANDLRPLWRW